MTRDYERDAFEKNTKDLECPETLTAAIVQEPSQFDEGPVQTCLLLSGILLELSYAAWYICHDVLHATVVHE